MKARGLRNNNPLNIEKGDDWQGLADEQTDSRFCTFKTPEYGFRAAAKILMGYQARYHCLTVRKMVDRWAPPIENDTDAYVRAVANAMGIGPDVPTSLKHQPELFRDMLRAMCVHENGSCPYDDSVIEEGMSLAGV